MCLRLGTGRGKEDYKYMLTKEDSYGRKITDCRKFIQSGVSKGWCSEISFDDKVFCTYVCDFFRKR